MLPEHWEVVCLSMARGCLYCHLASSSGRKRVDRRGCGTPEWLLAVLSMASNLLRAAFLDNPIGPPRGSLLSSMQILLLGCVAQLPFIPRKKYINVLSRGFC
jgi:hypothetical protein